MSAEHPDVIERDRSQTSPSIVNVNANHGTIILMNDEKSAVTTFTDLSFTAGMHLKTKSRSSVAVHGGLLESQSINIAGASSKHVENGTNAEIESDVPPEQSTHTTNLSEAANSSTDPSKYTTVSEEQRGWMPEY